MKKKYIVIFLLAIGIVMLCLSVVFAVISTANKNIIGGADLSTFLFVLRHEKKGLYFVLSILGLAVIIASVIFGMAKKKK